MAWDGADQGIGRDAGEKAAGGEKQPGPTLALWSYGLNAAVGGCRFIEICYNGIALMRKQVINFLAKIGDKL